MKSKRVISTILSVMLSISVIGCSSSTPMDNGEQHLEGQIKETPVAEPVIVGTYEAENANLAGNVKVATSKSEFSGTGYVEGFEKDEDVCTFNIEVTEAGFYDLNFVSASMGGEKYNYVSVDGEELGTFYNLGETFEDSMLKRVYMTAGSHKIAVKKYWGWIALDRLEVSVSAPIDEAIYNVTAALANPNANDTTKRLYSYLVDSYGEKILSGQFSDAGQYGKEFQVIKKETGKIPAVIGMDLMNYTPINVKNGAEANTIDYAIDFWNKGGIVTFCWHWNTPEKYVKDVWYSSFYTEHTNIDLAAIMNGEDTEGYDLLMQDIDAIAGVLQILEDNDVPILFRPLHEASGGWFWWGASGAEAYKKLYVLLYDRLTNEYGLDNLIWLWNGQDAEWYPGDEYVDIIGEDIYPGEKVYTSQVSKYLNAATNYSQETKLVYLSENGCVFDPELAKRDGAMWGMWCTWQGEFVAKDTAIFSLNEQYTESYMLKKAYEDESVITQDELPDFSTYPIHEELK